MKLTLEGDDGRLAKSWNLDKWDLSKPTAKAALIDEIAAEVASLQGGRGLDDWFEEGGSL